MDTTELRASLNMRNSMDFARYYGSQGRQAVIRLLAEAVQFGNQMQQIQDGVSIGQIIRQRLLQQPETYTTFLPSAGTDISWQPAQLDKQYNPGSLEFDWQIMQNQMNFIPGKFQFEITQYPDVRVEYLGKPTYVPPSAQPGLCGTPHNESGFLRQGSGISKKRPCIRCIAAFFQIIEKEDKS